MPKHKKKKKGVESEQVTEQPEIEEPLPPAQEKSDDEFIQKYTGENSQQAMWFRNIIRAQSKLVMQESITQEIQKVTSNFQQQLKQAMDMIEKLKSEVETLQLENAKKQRRIDRLEHENSRRHSESHNLKLKLDEFEQDKYGPCIQVVGLEESNDEKDDIKQLVKMVNKKTGAKIKSSDIVELNRMGKKNAIKARNTIVRLKDKPLREKLYEERKKLITPGNPAKSMYINDCLTKHRQQLLYTARQLVKRKKLFAAWSQHGNILVRKEEDSKVIHIKDNGDLMVLKEVEDEHDEVHQISHSIESDSVVSHLSDYDFYYDSDL